LPQDGVEADQGPYEYPIDLELELRKGIPHWNPNLRKRGLILG